MPQMASATWFASRSSRVNRLHLWAQVKASEDFPNEPADTGYGFKTAHLEYWRRQAVPVPDKTVIGTGRARM
jgi:hypothetical protein